MITPFEKSRMVFRRFTPFDKFQKAKIDIVSLYEDLTGNPIKKKTGRAVLVLCCFHSERHGSMALYPETSSFYCFSCGAGGDAIKFVMDREQVDFKESLEILKKYER